MVLNLQQQGVNQSFDFFSGFQDNMDLGHTVEFSVVIRGAEADAPCTSVLFALIFAARGGNSRMATLGVRLRTALAA